MININLFGGPGTGKSTNASGLFYKMKSKDYKVEYIQEFAKELTFGQDGMRLSDQMLILGEQHHRMFRLKGQVDYVIHDSPFVMGITYTDGANIPKKQYTKLVVKMFKSYDNINIFLKRNIKDHKYQSYGRNQTLKDAIKKDKEIMKMLDDNNIPYHVVKINKKTLKNIYKIIKDTK